MSKTNSLENSWLLLLLNNTNIANVGDATGLRGSSTAGSVYVSLHTSDPGEAGDQTTNEAAYGGYARVAVARSGSGWTVTGNSATNAAAIEFPACTSSSATVTHFGIGTASSGAGVLLYKGALTSSLAVTTTSNAIVRFTASSLTVTED